jgi:hypothetical protein
MKMKKKSGKASNKAMSKEKVVKKAKKILPRSKKMGTVDLPGSTPI